MVKIHWQCTRNESRARPLWQHIGYARSDATLSQVASALGAYSERAQCYGAAEYAFSLGAFLHDGTVLVSLANVDCPPHR